MPNYDYRCPKCGRTMEIVRSHKDVDKVVCRKCKKEMYRVIHSIPFKFK